MQGGLEKAERAEIERLRAEAQREMKAARHEAAIHVYQEPSPAGTALVDLLFTLWR